MAGSMLIYWRVNDFLNRWILGYRFFSEKPLSRIVVDMDFLIFINLFINHFQHFEDFEADESHQNWRFWRFSWSLYQQMVLKFMGVCGIPDPFFKGGGSRWGDKEILLLFSEAFKKGCWKIQDLGSDIRKNGLVESEFFWSWYHRLATGSSEIWVNSIFFGQVANVLRHVYLYLNSQLPKSGFNHISIK